MHVIKFDSEPWAKPTERYTTGIRMRQDEVGTERLSLALWLPVLRAIARTWGCQERPHFYQHSLITLVRDSAGQWMVPDSDMIVGERIDDERFEREDLELFEVNGLYVDHGDHEAADAPGEGIRFTTHDDWSAWLWPASEEQSRSVLRLMLKEHALHLGRDLDWAAIEAEAWERLLESCDVELRSDPKRGVLRMRWMDRDTAVWSWGWFVRATKTWRAAES